MKNHNEMIDKVFERRAEYENTQKAKYKRTIAIVISCILVLATTVSVYAISCIIKEKNIFQKAHESGIDISEVDTNGEFEYEDFSDKAKDENEITSETFEDPKVDIFNKMLNTIDYFDHLSLTLETSMLNNDKTSIEFQINITDGLSYEAVKENGYVLKETYCKDGNMIYVDNREEAYIENYLPAFDRSDTPYIKLADRITTEEDGLPCYHYRRNITNCPLASYTIVPQELAFSYLKDFENWEMVDNGYEYLGRSCVVLEGRTTPYIDEKHGADKFTMVVDFETGILMSFEGFKNGTAVSYTKVIDYSFESELSVKQFDINNYSFYEMEER